MLKILITFYSKNLEKIYTVRLSIPRPVQNKFSKSDYENEQHENDSGQGNSFSNIVFGVNL